MVPTSMLGMLTEIWRLPFKLFVRSVFVLRLVWRKGLTSSSQLCNYSSQHSVLDPDQ